MNNIDKMERKSPRDVGRATTLNSALPWKVWLRIEQWTDEINEPFALHFNEQDTIDDLKTKIFDKLNGLRWSRLNDNASIAIAYYVSRDFIDERTPPFPRPPSSPVDATSSFSGRNRSFHYPKPLALGISEDFSRRCYSVTASPSRSASNSPNLVKIWQPPLVRYRSASPYGRLGGTSVPHPQSTMNAAKRVPGVLNKSYEFPPEEKDNDSPDMKISFEPDELIITVYSSLFGHIGSQRASEALFVVCNEREPALSVTAPPPALSAINASTYVPTNEEIDRQLSDIQASGMKEGLFLETDLPHGSTNDNEEIEVPALLDSTTPTDEEGEIEREFKLITNEEQLKKESRCLQDTEHATDSPKPAILLLPKNYTGGVDLNELDSKFSSDSSSPGSTGGNDCETGRQSQQAISTSSYAPLDENEIGLIHPLLESERKKNTSSCPSSPQLPAKPTTIVPSLRSNTSITSLHENQLPNGFTTPTNHEIFPKINVLIVEDNVINQAILRSFLKKHKISYKVAKNGQEAVDRWKEGGIDLIFMDLQLPVFSGMDAAKKIRDLEKQNISKQNNSVRTSNNKAPVIIVAFTASNSLVDKREALLSGCNDYLTKPVNLHWLSKKINEWGCMQALIDFDGWKKGQSRMTDSVIKASPKFPKASEFNSGHSSSSRRSRNTSETRQ
ncbi:hypothetical protein HG536_0E04090 [Torulaspora globosa]|uniref:Response regulatory domain-containing protein n=1 Tax=Torulaspora globosa TaxID=48254 RepID=A0A7G3ZJ12_9SACH|nr:uncharacterized protein HG536_0E04090 [Torulaspora globosa]QLL33498.1 hypothetical protein HG536_0E04090 [Torulaspora globosa]